MKAIAITGVTGDIGGGLLQHFAQQTGCRVTGLVRDGKQPEIATARLLTFSDESLYPAHLFDELAAGDVVIHAAAKLNMPGNTHAECVRYLATNAFLAALLARSCHRRATHFVYLSSEMVYELPDTPDLRALGTAFTDFCQRKLAAADMYDTAKLATAFMNELPNLSFDKLPMYAVSKYLGELAAQTVPAATIIRITNAYGPDYTNPRLIPRLLVGRLTGHGSTAPDTTRDFVHADDLAKLVQVAIEQPIFGTIDGKSGERTAIKELCEQIVSLTPTAYGKLELQAVDAGATHKPLVAPADVTLSDSIGEPIAFNDGLLETLKSHKARCYHQMADTRTIEDFLKPGETLVRELHGSSAAYLYVVRDKDGHQAVRKIAIRDGVEGNGIAKVAEEIRYYRYIAHRRPTLARLYPKLLGARLDRSYSSEIIEYLDGPNLYEALRSETLPYDTYKASLRQLLNDISQYGVGVLTTPKDGQTQLNAYYLDRALTRLEPIHDLIGKADTLTINGQTIPAPHVLLARIAVDKELRELLLPRTECFCIHGDLTLLNTVFLQNDHRVKLIDPRGYIGKWDPLYDFGKLAFTLSGFGEFIVARPPLSTNAAGSYTIDFDAIPRNSRRLRSEFYQFLADSEPFARRIISAEPHWRERIQFAEAIHYLSDIPFRLFTDEGTDTALASYVFGAYYLHAAYERMMHD